MNRGARALQWLSYSDRHPGDEHAVVGNIRVLEAVHSPQLDNERELLVYLPSSYGEGSRHYPVVYMHDGQNLFDPATSHAGEWGVDDTLEAMGSGGPEAIIVGIPHAGDRRIEEYSPFVDPEQGGGRGDDYLAFVVESVKPIIDQSFRTLPDWGHTGIAGSSMGGLISLYGLFRRAETFGFAGVLSPALWFAGGAIFPWIEQADFVPARIYLDAGTREGKRTVADLRRMRDLLIARGYRLGEDLLHVVEKGGRHTEAAWGRRFGSALGFLLDAGTSGA